MASATLLQSDFLQSLVYYIKAIHHAPTPSAHLKALREVHSYLDSLTQENHQAVAQLVLERNSLAQQCKIPQLDARYCHILCDKSEQLGHQLTFDKIQKALAELWISEQQIDLWRKALVLPLHCLQPPQSFQAPAPPRATAAQRREHGRRHLDIEQPIIPTVVLSPSSLQSGSRPRPPASKQQPLNHDYVEIDNRNVELDHSYIRPETSNAE